MVITIGLMYDLTIAIKNIVIGIVHYLLVDYNNISI